MDILTLGYMAGMAIFASGTTLLLSKRKTSKGFTIKSDGKVKVDGESYKKDTPASGDALRDLVDDVVKNASDKILGMKNVTGIRIQGSANVSLISNKLIVDETAVLEIKKQTLWISNESSSNVTVSGVFNVSIGGTSNFKRDIPMVDFDSSKLARISVDGSGDIEIASMQLANEVDAIVQGSGDIVLTDISTGTLSLSVQGSGDITVSKKCKATQTFAKVQGSGDIEIKSTTVGVVTEKVQGSGDIKLANGTKTKVRKTKTSYFHQSQTDGRYFNRTAPNLKREVISIRKGTEEPTYMDEY